MITASVSINTQGIDKMVSQSARLADLSVRRCAEATLPLASSLAPVDTGALKVSGRVIRIRDGVYDLTFFGGAGGRIYALYQEMGTKYMKAQPYLAPAIKKINYNAIVMATVREVLGL